MSNFYIYNSETDSENSVSTFDYYSDNTHEDDEDLELYDPEEISPSKFNLVLIHEFNESLQTSIYGNYKDVTCNYLVICRFKNNTKFCSIVDCYSNIIPEYYRPKLEIAECQYLISGHCVGILKTFWIRLIQRTWKKIFKLRKICLTKRRHISSLKYKELYGKWPINCLNYPSFKGMLNYLF
jgi:hypothetical protein